MKQIIIFDFDGTVADTGPLIRKIYDEIATKNRLTVMTDEAYLMLRKGSLKDAKKWSGVKFWQFPFLLWNVRKLMKREAESVQLFPGVAELINELHANGHQLYILSRNRSDTIIRVLERYELEDKLIVLERRRRSFGSKAEVISRLVRKNQFNKADVWMIGDEVRDVEAGKRAGVKSLAVGWGLQDESILKMFEPTAYVGTVTELRTILTT